MGIADEVSRSMLRVGEARWGPVRFEGLGVVSRPEGIFERWMASFMAGGPVVGALAGNALRALAVEVDYAANSVRLRQHSENVAGDLDLLGLILQPHEDGSYLLLGTSEGAHPRTQRALRPGDRLIAIDGSEISGSGFAAVVDATRGALGSEHTVVVRRDGRDISLSLPVTRLL